MRRACTTALLAVVIAGAAPAWARSPGQDDLDLGVSQYRSGRFDEALASFRRAVELDPSLIKAWENIGWAEHRLGDDREALRVWRTVLKLEPRNVPAWNAIGEVELARGSWSPAAAALESSLALEPGQTEVRLRLGQAYESLRRPEDAAAQYRSILERRPGDAKATIRLADLEEARGRLEIAEGTLRTGLAAGLDPGSAISTRLARVLAKQGDEAYRAERWGEAIDAYEEAVARDPARTVYLVNLGWAHRRADDAEGAVSAWTQALARDVASPADLWRAVGDAERDRGRSAAAREAYARSAKSDPRATAALYSLAALALESGDTDAAASAIREMLAAGSAGEEEVVRAADLYIRQEAIPEGQSLFESLASEPERAGGISIGLARLYAARGGAAYRAGSDDEARTFYEKALAFDPRNRAALRDYGWTLWRLGDWAGVRRVWDRYAVAYPGLPEPRELLGRLELHHGSPGRAIEQAEAALAIDGDALGPNVLLARAYLADGKYRRARDLGRTLAETHPDDLPVQTLYGETLWRSLDFGEASVQWRKILDMGWNTPRAMHYWIRATYETGAYAEAIAEAESAVAEGIATEPLLRLLAEDAVVRGDDDATVRWYRRLTEAFPRRVGYWTALAETYRRMEKPAAEAEVLDAAFVRHPRSPEIALLQADLELRRRRPSRALEEYRALGERLGRNQTVFEGELASLRALDRSAEALALLRAEGPGYLDPNERALEEASILEEMGRREEAAAVRSRIVDPPAGTVEIPILLYHGIADHPRTLSLPRSRFEDHMQAIRDAGYATVTIAEIDAALSGGRPLPARPIAITFDDARADSFRFGDPLLARLGMKATMFVPTVRIADESAFNTDWASLRRLAGTGRWDFQAHGHLAHDPIPVDGDQGIAEFLVNRQWLADEQRLETHEEFVLRVEGDYETCLQRMRDHIPGSTVVGYAFPFSEMGQLHGGNDPDALAVNERAFARRYRYGFVQDATGYNTLVPGDGRTPLLLNRLNVPRDWEADRLLAHLASQSPARRARVEAARWDIAHAEYRNAEAGLRALIVEEPRTYPEAGVVLARDLLEQRREREAASALGLVPTGPVWGRPDASRRKLARDLAWETDTRAGAEVQLVGDSDGRDSLEVVATGRYPLAAPVDLWGSAGAVRFRDSDLPSLAGFQGTLGADWVGGRSVTAGGWLRGRSLDDDVSTFEGEGSVRVVLDGQSFGGACGVTSVETVGALRSEVMRRGCQGLYDIRRRTWRSRVRVAYGDLTDGNDVLTGWADGTVDVLPRWRISAGGRVEAGDSRTTSPLYYAPSGLVSALGLVRYARAFAAGATLDAEAALGPSRDDVAGTRLVGRARLAWTQDWGDRWRSTVTAEYGETPDYRRTAMTLSFGYRF